MNRRRYNPEEITGFLHQVDLGIPVKDLCRKHGFTEQTYYRWKRQFAGMGTAEVRELQEMRKVFSALVARFAEQPFMR